MLTLLSPAKTLDYESPLLTQRYSEPQMLDQSQLLVNRLRELSPPQLGELMKLSDKLANLNFGRYLDWQAPFSPDNARPALWAFKGDVYTGLRAEEFDDADLDFAQQHLRILSGLYGVLRPLDLMQPYRLEMGTRLQTGRGANLYQFWGDRITRVLDQQLGDGPERELVNLASVEYFSAVQPQGLDATVVTPVFRDLKQGVYKVISFYAKQARGHMANWIVRNRIDRADRLVEFNEAGYRYCAAESSPDQPVFLRDKPASA